MGTKKQVERVHNIQDVVKSIGNYVFKSNDTNHPECRGLYRMSDMKLGSSPEPQELEAQLPEPMRSVPEEEPKTEEPEHSDSVQNLLDAATPTVGVSQGYIKGATYKYKNTYRTRTGPTR